MDTETHAGAADDPGLGHNNPPDPPDPIDLLSQRLRADNFETFGRVAELTASAGKAPKTIMTEDQAQKVTTLVKMLKTAKTRAGRVRTAEKQPFLQGGRAVDALFKSEAETPCQEWIDDLEGRLAKFQLRKVEAERRRREQEADRLAAEAEKKTKAAIDAADQGAPDAELARDALQTRDEATDARLQSLAGVSDLGRTRDAGTGAVASFRKVWTFEIEDPSKIDLNTLRQHLSADEINKAIARFVRAGGRDLGGVRIFEDIKTTVR